MLNPFPFVVFSCSSCSDSELNDDPHSDNSPSDESESESESPIHLPLPFLFVVLLTSSRNFLLLFNNNSSISVVIVWVLMSLPMNFLFLIERIRFLFHQVNKVISTRMKTSKYNVLQKLSYCIRIESIVLQ